jgi:hypothetical protein
MDLHVLHAGRERRRIERVRERHPDRLIHQRVVDPAPGDVGPARIRRLEPLGTVELPVALTRVKTSD